MLLEWQALMETERKQCSQLSETDKFIYFLLLQFRSPYGWGKENPETADCSGSVCLALMMALLAAFLCDHHRNGAHSSRSDTCHPR